MITFRPARGSLSRTTLATGEIMVGVTLAHTWAGGALPSAGWLIALTGLVFGASWLVVPGRTSMVPMLLGLGVAQFGIHALLMLAAGHGAHLLQVSTPMLTAHAVSALLTAAVWRLRRRMLASIIDWPALGPVPVRTTLAVPLPAPTLPRSQQVLTAAPRRGPPAALCRA
ncbi:cell division protein FtsQ [Nocardioides limicola]|uniref:cell division protein FtsQ n=1 Tax=Nocardioides limicola TaxID=2803368 RepID=UPI00193BBF01|nr:cell division protein FtsQ [Nocardioides sp. DJM-14]